MSSETGAVRVEVHDWPGGDPAEGYARWDEFDAWVMALLLTDPQDGAAPPRGAPLAVK